MKILFSKRLLVVSFLVILLSLSFISMSTTAAFAHVNAAPGFGFSVNPTQGAPGTVVTVTGSSWTQGEIVDISLSPSTTVLISITASLSEGMLTGTFTVPANAAPGNQFVNADGRIGNETAQAPFTVLSSLVPTQTVDLQTLNVQSLQPLVANSSPTLRAYIRNNGSAASGNFNVRWTADGAIADGGHYSIPAGAVDTHDYIWHNITAGQHSITFIANFDHGVTETDYSNNQFTLTFTVSASNPPPGPPPTITPGGMWVYPASGFTFTQGNTYNLVVRGYQTNPNDPAIAYVNITGYWNNAWHVLCHIPNNRPDLGDNYYCSTTFLLNGKYPPSGKLTLSFDVYDVAGNKNLSPNGLHTGTFLTNTPMPVLSDYPYQPSSATLTKTGQLNPLAVKLVQCLADPALKLVKVAGLGTHAYKVIEAIYQVYDKGSTGVAVIQDTSTGNFKGVVIELVKAGIPYEPCFELIHDLTPVQAVY